MLRMTLRWILVAGAALGIGFETMAATAQDQAADCIDCHRTRGNLGAQLPRIEGQHAAYLARELGRFRDTHRKNLPMQIVASALTRDQLQALAAELAARPWDPKPQRTDAAAATAGSPLAAALACSSCHGPTFRGAHLVPRLAGQNPEYLARQLRAFDSGHRELSLPEAALSMKGLNAAEINALAHYLSSLDGRVNLDWLAGSWCSQSSTQRSEEWWTPARGGLLLGLHRDLDGAGLLSGFEFLRIEIGDGVAVYHAQPGGRPPVPFQLVEAGAAYAVFTNPEHDYPRRLRYQRFDRTLRATVDDGAGGEALKFEWTLDCATAAH